MALCIGVLFGQTISGGTLNPRLEKPAG